MGVLSFLNISSSSKEFSINKLPRNIQTQINNFYQDKLTEVELKSIFINNDLKIDLNKFHLSIDGLVRVIKTEKEKFQSRRNSLKFLGKAAALGLGINLGISKVANAGLVLGNKDKRTILAFNNECPKVSNFFLKLKSIPEFQRLGDVFMGGDEFPIIIIFGDIHKGNDFCSKDEIDLVSTNVKYYNLSRNQTWVSDYNKLSILKNKFNLKFIGIEGWAGNDVDRKRGKIILNAESLLVQNILSKKEFNLIPLENEKLQVNALKINNFYKNTRDLRFRTLIENKNLLSFIVKYYFNLSEDQMYNNRENIIKSIIQYGDSINFSIEGSSGNAFHDLYLFLLDFIFNFKKINLKILNSFEFIVEEIQKFYFDLVKEYGSSNYDKKKFDLEVLTKRNQYAVEKMLKEMKNNNEQIGVIVFGLGHVKGLIEELKKQTKEKINIYIFN